MNVIKGIIEDCNKSDLVSNKVIKKVIEIIGQEEWHDLRKDPSDLPKVNQKVLLQIKDKDEPITDFYTQNNIWNFANKYEAIAWCEIPTYTEDTN